jgi:hypothetical protein
MALAVALKMYHLTHSLPFPASGNGSTLPKHYVSLSKVKTHLCAKLQPYQTDNPVKIIKIPS